MWMLYPLPQANLDPHQHLAMSKWRQEIENAIRKWRRDPNYIAVFPIPTGFQQIGGDARALSMMEEIRFLQETMIVGLQVPREFLLGGLSWSGSSVTFRMVENFFLNHIRGLRQLMKFVVDRVSAATGLKPIELSMTRLKWVDDVQQKSLLMQANLNGKISDETFIKELGHDMAKEFGKMLEEADKRGELLKKQMKAQAEAQGEAMLAQLQYQMKMQQEQAKMSRDLVAEWKAMGYTPEQIQMMMAATSATQPMGGQFTPGGVLGHEPNKAGTNGAGATPQMFNADVWAGQFASALQQMDDTKREAMMAQLQLQSPDLHGAVSQKLTASVDARPQPEQKPPRRNAGKAPTPSSVGK